MKAAPQRRNSARWPITLAIAYLIAILVLWLWLRSADESPGATLFLFGPRWVVGLPLVVLVPLAIRARTWRVAVPTAIAATIVAGPLTGGTIDTGRPFRTERLALTNLCVASWNMGGLPAKSSLKSFLAEARINVLVTQESGLVAESLPEGWSLAGDAGNRVAARFPVRLAESHDFWQTLNISGRLDRFVLQAPDAEVTLIAIHLPTPRPGLETAIGSNFRDLSELRRINELRAEASHQARGWIGTNRTNLIIAGDFNMPVETRVYRDYWATYRNSFSEVGTGWGTTKQTNWFGTRIDHVLYTAQWECRRAWVGPAMGSDHRPIVAELALVDD